MNLGPATNRTRRVSFNSQSRQFKSLQVQRHKISCGKKFRVDARYQFNNHGRGKSGRRCNHWVQEAFTAFDFYVSLVKAGRTRSPAEAGLPQEDVSA